MAVRFPVGTDIFAEIRQENKYYVDKTGLIREILADSFKVMLITRPRRFGKTLAMSMLADYFDISKESKKHFFGLDISGESTLTDRWMNRWPVIFLSFKSVEGGTYSLAYGRLKVVISTLCKKYDFLRNSEKVNEMDKNLLICMEEQTADEANLTNVLVLLTRMLADHYGRSAIVLVDEYDVPLAKAQENGYYREMLDVIRAMLGDTLKTNENLKFAIITGCLRIAKESVFTGMNNFVTDTISNERLDEYFGFTEEDVRKLLEDANLQERIETFRAWYDGYRFGSVDVYCPWDVLNYARDLQMNPQAQPEAYWANSSGNYIVRRFLNKAGRTTKKEIESLIAGESVTKCISQQLTYEELEKNIENLWSTLYMTGYLTTRSKTEGDNYELVIPNHGVRKIFAEQIKKWFEEEIVEKDISSYDALCKAFTEGNEEKIEELLNMFLGRSISIRDTFAKKPQKENFYHGILIGMFMGRDDWYVRSNAEAGDGYSDIQVEINDTTAMVVEVKYAEAGYMETACQKALKQIEQMRYADGLKQEGYSTIYAYGLACYKKKCIVSCKIYKSEKP